MPCRAAAAAAEDDLRQLHLAFDDRAVARLQAPIGTTCVRSS